jgi:hypothetical protein
MIDKNQIKVDGETWHVPHEEVDSRASLERKDFPIEHIRSKLEKESDGINV